MGEQTLRTGDVIVSAGFHWGEWASGAASVMGERDVS